MTTQIRMASLALAAAVLAAPAGAATMQAVYTGTVSGQNGDLTGLFGAAGGSLTGQTFSMTFLYDTAVGQRLTDADGDRTFGGTNYGTPAIPSPSLGASITIGGFTHSVAGSYHANFQLTDVAGTAAKDGFYTQVQDYPFQSDGSYSLNFLDAFFTELTNILPASLDTPFSLAIPSTATATAGGYFQFISFDGSTSQFTQYTYGSLFLNRVDVTTVGGGGGGGPAPVPLPASALALLAGLGGMGAMRLRRQAQRQRD